MKNNKPKFAGTMLVVKDVEKSKKFYQEVLGLGIVMDLCENVTFTGGFSILDFKLWVSVLGKEERDFKFGGNDKELYFEVDDLEAFVKELEKFDDINFLNGIEEAPRLQRSLKIFDPDMHLIEVGETMKSLVDRLTKSGMSVEEISAKTALPINFVEELL